VGKIPVETLAEQMYRTVAESPGKKLKAGDLTAAMIARYGEEACTRGDCRRALRLLIESGRCVYGYFGGAHIQLPHAGRTAPDV
jgi:hypothetical protein